MFTMGLTTFIDLRAFLFVCQLSSLQIQFDYIVRGEGLVYHLDKRDRILLFPGPETPVSKCQPLPKCRYKHLWMGICHSALAFYVHFYIQLCEKSDAIKCQSRLAFTQMQVLAFGRWLAFGDSGFGLTHTGRTFGYGEFSFLLGQMSICFGEF